MPGSVTISFEGITIETLTLAAAMETSGTHAFSFDPASPGASAEIASGGPIVDGTYQVVLSYRDTAGSPIASATSSQVVIDTNHPGSGMMSSDIAGSNPPVGSRWATYPTSQLRGFGTADATGQPIQRLVTAFAPWESNTPPRIAMVTGTDIRVTLSKTVAGRTYRLQRTESLTSGTWEDVGPAVTGSGSAIMLQDAATPDLRNRFYRVQIVQYLWVRERFSKKFCSARSMTVADFTRRTKSSGCWV